MDDVLLDTSASAIEFHKKENPFGDPSKRGSRDVAGAVGMSWKDFWWTLPQEFWATIPKMIWCDDIIKLAQEYFGKNVYLLTSPIPNGACSAGKQLWVNEYLPSFMGELIIAHKKYAVVGDDGLLIDDSQVNQAKFKKYNKEQNFYLFPSYQNELSNIMDVILKDKMIVYHMIKSKLESL